MSWFDGGFLSGLGSLFGGGGGDTFSMPSSVEPDVLGSAANTAASTGGSLDASGGITPGGFGGFGGGGASPDIGGANPAMFGGGPQSETFDPARVGPPPPGGPAPAPPPATVGSVAPNQGGSVAGNNFGPSQDQESLARTGNPVTEPGAPIPAYQGFQGRPTPPTAWESVQNAPGKWWNQISTGAGNEVDQAMSHPIRTGLTAATMGAPLVAAMMAPSGPKMPKAANTAQLPVAPLPGTTDNASLPASSPMSPLLGAGPQGGFKVKGGRGLRQGGRV